MGAGERSANELIMEKREGVHPTFFPTNKEWYSQVALLSQRELLKRKEHFAKVRLAKQKGEMGKVKQLQLERKQYTYRRWYLTNRETELVKIRERKARRLEKVKTCELKKKMRDDCCSSNQLGSQPPPEDGFTMWVCRCTTCELVQYGILGVDQQGRPGTYFRGRWFSFIYPEFGVGIDQAGEMMSLK